MRNGGAGPLSLCLNVRKNFLMGRAVQGWVRNQLPLTWVLKQRPEAPQEESAPVETAEPGGPLPGTPFPRTCALVAGCAGRWPCPLAGSGQTQSWSPPQDARCPAEWSAPGPGGWHLGAQSEEGTRSYQIGTTRPSGLAPPGQANTLGEPSTPPPGRYTTPCGHSPAREMVVKTEHGMRAWPLFTQGGKSTMPRYSARYQGQHPTPHS